VSDAPRRAPRLRARRRRPDRLAVPTHPSPIRTRRSPTCRPRSAATTGLAGFRRSASSRWSALRPTVASGTTVPATTLYPLGSCTMKYNPVVNEAVARLPGFAALHPRARPAGAGCARVDRGAGACLAAVSGLDAVCLQPAAGAQGELLGMLLIRAYHTDRGDPRRRVLIPSSAHGTNPASAALCGYDGHRGARRRPRPAARARRRRGDGRVRRRTHGDEPEHARPLRGGDRGGRGGGPCARWPRVHGRRQRERR